MLGRRYAGNPELPTPSDRHSKIIFFLPQTELVNFVENFFFLTSFFLTFVLNMVFPFYMYIPFSLSFSQPLWAQP